jgi:predicted dehydrogenase
LLFVDYSYRFLATVDALRGALAAVGRVQALRSEFHNIYGPGIEKAWFFDRQLSGGGALVDLGVHLIDLALWLIQPDDVTLERAELDSGPIEREATLGLRLNGSIPFDMAVSWNAPLAETRIVFEVAGDRGDVRWENVDGSFYRFRTIHNQRLLIDRETTLRHDTLQALADALESGLAPAIDTRVYALLDQAYGWVFSS